MKTFKSVHDLDWMCKTADRLLLSMALSRNGRELITMFGKGDEKDNLEALFNWFDTLDSPASRRVQRVNIEFLAIMRWCMNQMLAKPYPRAVYEDSEPYTQASEIQCENLAHTLVFLVSCYFLTLKGQGQSVYLREWDIEKARRHCSDKIKSFDLHYQVCLTLEMPRLASHYFHNSVKPWMARLEAPNRG